MFQTSYTIETISAPPAAFPFSPFSDCETRSLYYVDFLANNTPTLYRYDCIRKLFYRAIIVNQGAAAFCIPIKGSRDLFAVGLGHCCCVVKWNGCSPYAYKLKEIFCVEQQPNFENHGFSLARPDPTGRLYAGTFKSTLCDTSFPSDCSLYSYDKYRGVQQQVSGLKLSAGLAWNTKKRCTYHIGSCLDLRKFSWNPHTGALGEE